MKLGNHGRSKQTAGSGLHSRGLLSGLIGQRRLGEEGEWEMEDVPRLHGPKQGLLERQFPPTKNRSASGFHDRTQAPYIHGRVFGIQLDQVVRGRLGEDCLHHKPRALLLQGNALRTEKCRSNLLKVSE